MKILIVCSFNSGNISPFIQEQVNSLKKNNIKIDYFKVQGRGISGYLKNLKALRQTIKNGDYDLIHAHYGLSGLLANLQQIIPVITTYHGSDINKSFNNVLSSFSAKMSDWNIYVYKKLYNKLYLSPQNYSIIPCGINLEEMVQISRKDARNKLRLNNQKKYILFSSSFDRPVKNSALAKKAVNYLEGNIQLVELKGYSRFEVVLLMNACDLLLLTSFTEGSPQVIKEAMACGLPIVSTDVGDVKGIISDIDGCWVTSFEAKDITKKIEQALHFEGKTDGRKEANRFDNKLIAQFISALYEDAIA